MGDSQLPAGTIGLRSGSRGEDVSDSRYEGRRGALQEGMRERHVYQAMKVRLRGPPRAPNHAHVGESISTSEVEDDGESEDDEWGGKEQVHRGFHY